MTTAYTSAQTVTASPVGSELVLATQSVTALPAGSVSLDAQQLINSAPPKLKLQRWGGVSAITVAPAFSPSDVAGLAAWYDATQITGLVDGDTVTTWADLSGNDITMIGYGTPAYWTSGMNGKPAVQFDSVQGEFFSAESVDDLELTGDFLILAAVKFLTVGGGQRTIVSKHYERWELMESAAKIGGYVGGSSNSIYNPAAGATVAINTEYVVGLRRTATSAFSTRLDGTEDGTATNSAAGTGGTPAHIGARPTQGYFYDGYIGEVIICNQDVLPEDLSLLEAYMADKWLP